MLDAAESNSIIGRPDAATIPVPLRGRAFARLGPGELVAFQSSYGGTPLEAEQTLHLHLDDFTVGGPGGGGGRKRSRSSSGQSWASIVSTGALNAHILGTPKYR